MLIVGELINASRKSVKEMIEKRDAAGIARLAQDQGEHGADFIDVNAGVFVGQEPELLKWIVASVQETVDAPCCIDSPDPKAIEAALAVHKGQAMINSISLEKERYDALLPLVAGSGSKVVALCMSDEGMPQTADQRMAIADKLVNGLVRNNVAIENIYVDPLVQPVSTDNTFGVEFLQAIEQITRTFKGVHTMCGLSNISFGLPERKFINQTFMVLAIGRGLDGAIVNPLDARMMGCITTAEMLMGRDSYCMNYLKAYRAGTARTERLNAERPTEPQEVLPMKLVVLDGHTLNPGDLSWDPLRAFGEVAVYARTAEADIVARARGAEVLLTNKVPISKATLERLDALEFIAVTATGYDMVDTAAAGKRGVPVANVPEYGTDSVAQFVFALILALCHRVEAHDGSVKAGQWAKAPDWCFWNTPQVLLHGKKMGIVGFGRIGRRVGELAHAFGMAVTAFDPGNQTPPGFSNFKFAPLEELFADADVVTLHCLMNDRNRGFVDRGLLGRMRKDAFLINASRGGLVNERDLAEALDGGRLAGAAVDVVSAEPIRPDNPLLERQKLPDHPSHRLGQRIRPPEPDEHDRGEHQGVCGRPAGQRRQRTRVIKAGTEG